jgi:hypothetical protein
MLAPVAVAEAQVKLGVVGDSLLDEHFDQTGFGVNLGYSKNGFELIVDTGQINAGSIGTWGATRNNGYEYNWALAGSTTDSLIGDSQHTNLAAQIGSAGITKAVMIVGSNNLFPYLPTFANSGSLGSSYETIYEGLASAGQIENIANLAVDDVISAAQTLKNTGVDLIIATAPEYGISPFAKSFYTDPLKRDRVDDVMETYNQRATARLTSEIGVPVVDLYRMTKDIWGDHGAENSFFELGGVQIDLNGTGGVALADVLNGSFNPAAVTSDTADAFVHDGIHPNTAINGMFANLYLTAFNQEFGDSFALFTEQQMLSNAGSALGAQYTGETLSGSLGGKTYSDYIISAVPEPTCGSLVAIFTIGCGLKRTRRRC